MTIVDKPYDRQPNESESAWLAFCCYRDLPPPRTLDAAAVVYSTTKGGKGRKANRHLTGWRQTHEWDERVKQYDIDRSNLVKEKLANADKEKYLATLENFRQKIETIGSNALTAANISISRVVFELNTINKETGEKPIGRENWRLFTEGNRIVRDALGSAHEAKGLLIEAYGLVETIEKLNDGTN